MKEQIVADYYKEYHIKIYTYCTYLLKNKDYGYDAMQNVFLKLIEYFDSFRDRKAIPRWLYVTAKNHCMNVLRRDSRITFTDDVCDIPFDSEDSAIFYDLQNYIRNPKVIDAIYFTYIDRLPQRDIQKVTGQSPATIRRNLKKFKEMVPVLQRELCA